MMNEALDPGWTGVDCLEDIDECQTIQPCRAATICINLVGSYKCQCFESFTGQNCEVVREKKQWKKFNEFININRMYVNSEYLGKYSY